MSFSIFRDLKILRWVQQQVWVFSILSTAWAWASIILVRKCGSHHHSMMSFCENVIYTGGSKISNIRIFIIFCRSGEGLTSLNKDLQVFWWKKKGHWSIQGCLFFDNMQKVFTHSLPGIKRSLLYGTRKTHDLPPSKIPLLRKATVYEWWLNKLNFGRRLWNH